MPDDRSSGSPIPAAVWLGSVHDAVGPSGGAPLTEEEQTALLDIARIAAHSSERITAPLTTFLAGVAFGALPPGERANALRTLASKLER
jgi:hypothetical protein